MIWDYGRRCGSSEKGRVGGEKEMLYMADGSIKSEHGKYLSGELIENLSPI